MVDRLHGRLGAVDAADAAVGRDRDLVRDRLHVGRAMHDGGAEEIRDVLHEIAAERDVQDLHAAADAQHGKPRTLERGAHQYELEVVALVAHAVVRLVRVAAVVVGMDVAAAREDEPGDGVERLVHGAEHGRQDDRDATAASHGVDVFARY